ncbi:hypothetical protein DH2020_047984 [Rehmannia glutinosa]|uniref:Uncharacterized protein n=1 Tax=Rehmannia glutinosa TaxID=99300 RepID=A0ABR0U6R0_REHGL
MRKRKSIASPVRFHHNIMQKDPKVKYFSDPRAKMVSLKKTPEIFKGGLDLNCCPGRENTASSRVSMMSLLQEASLPLETYLRQNGLTSLVSDQQTTSPPGENIAQAQEDDCGVSPVIEEHEEGSNEIHEQSRMTIYGFPVDHFPPMRA